jgi:hypothetical protein
MSAVELRLRIGRIVTTAPIGLPRDQFGELLAEAVRAKLAGPAVRPHASAGAGGAAGVAAHIADGIAARLPAPQVLSSRRAP